jgi:uncharacterized protein
VIAYVDSSVLLRIVLGQPGRLAKWKEIETGVASSLVEVECLRTLDRLRMESSLDAEAIAERREVVYRLLESMEVVEPSPIILRRASSPMPTVLGTLDAIHLATALMWSDVRGVRLKMLTHDRALATAARASGLEVLGV